MAASFHERVEVLAERWARAGRPADQLLVNWPLLRAQRWRYSRGGRSAPVSETLRAFVAASYAEYGERAYDALDRERAVCRGCGTQYRLENLNICTACDKVYCDRCAARLLRAGSGNQACPCGGELVG